MEFQIENMKVYPKTIPPDSLISEALSRIDFSDNYGIKISSAYPVEQEELPILFFKSFPKWVEILLYIRESLAKIIGLKTAEGMNIEKQIREFKADKGQSIALFKVYGKTSQELMLGQDDRHLDFRLSIFTVKEGDFTEISLATTVQFNGWLGKAYFVPVKPFHKIIVRLTLKRLAEQITKNKNSR